MKKSLAILLSALLVVAIFAVPASALTWEDNQTMNGENYVFDNAYGYVFNVGSVNGKIGGEDCTVITNVDAYKAANPNWAVSVLLAPTSDANVYEVVLVTENPQSADNGLAKGINFDNGNICLIAHSAYSNPNGANWQSKLAALALKAGDKITFAGIDFAAGTATDATATVQNDPEDAVVVIPSVNVAAGKSYTASLLFRQGGREAGWGWDENAAIAYPDEDDKTMTDGVIAADDVAYDDAVWAGWNHNSPDYKENGYSWITVDLGAVTDLAEASIYLGASGLGQGIGAKNMTVEILVSDDGEEFASVGNAVPEDSEEVSCVKTTVKFDTAVSGRYVQFRMVRGGWMFVSEVEVYNVGSGNTTTTVKEEITVDGDLSDNGWNAENWTEVTPDNGYWQALPTTDTLSYKYQLRTDDTKLYAAFEIDCAAVEGGNGSGTNVRFWINSDDEATVYTHFYDVFVGGTGAKYNQAKDANKGAAIENSTINAVLTTEGEKTYVEFSVDLAEFNGAEGFNYFVCVSNKINENVCLYFPAVVEGESRLSNLPYNVWYAEGQATADVEELALGEITVDNGSDDEEEPKEDVEAEMKELLGAAPADAKVDYVIEAPESYEAGDEITVTVTVKNITAENGIHVAAFKLLYDNEKLLLTNDLDEEDENALLCVKTLPKDWENLSSVANDYNADNEEGTVVNPLNDGVINVSVFTAKSTASAAIKEDGALVLEFTFKALEDAEGDIGLVIPHADAEGAYNGKDGEIVYEANGSYAVIKAPVVEEPSKPVDPEKPVKPGDASSMIIFAIIALVAIAGSAVVIKTRK